MKRFRLCAVLVLTMTLSPAWGQANDVVEAFLTTEGYLTVDSLELEQMVEDGLPASESVFLVGGRLSPLAKSIHALEALDGVQDRARYYVSASLVPSTDLVLIQLDRFNLGPVLRQELIDSIGEEHVAPAEEFGVGPHVSLRLVTTQVMGNEAAIVGAARMEMDDPGAAASFCLLAPCLQLAPAAEGEGFLDDLEQMGVELAVDYGAERDGLPVPAAMLDMLVGVSGLVLHGSEALLEFQGASFVVAEALLETNLAQENGVDGVIRLGALLDDSVAATWHRLVAFPGWHEGGLLFGAAAVECRRGDPVGGLCP